MPREVEIVESDGTPVNWGSIGGGGGGATGIGTGENMGDKNDTYANSAVINTVKTLDFPLGELDRQIDAGYNISVYNPTSSVLRVKLQRRLGLTP